MFLTVYLSNNDQHFTEVPITPDTLCRDVVDLCKEAGESDCHLSETWRGSGEHYLLHVVSEKEPKGILAARLAVWQFVLEASSCSQMQMDSIISMTNQSTQTPSSILTIPEKYSHLELKEVVASVLPR